MKVTVVSTAFEKTSRLKQHRMVQDVIKDEVAQLHGLNILASTPK
jgi:stress-induced morphogen